ncbi:hypothetical protein RvY_03301 [Ramazzottius varieornatus]|uniref:Uncharacterized protein n=1 Tax=Ramazzottius varieornatus TaxID=947166 RepID=A0A1D1UMM2_RAMVA|nr:hypothetical protein RvY_03301 [Ramazzottius varieornatus]
MLHNTAQVTNTFVPITSPPINIQISTSPQRADYTTVFGNIPHYKCFIAVRLELTVCC